MGKSIKVDGKRSLAKTKKEMPFRVGTERSESRLPRDMKSKQRTWIMAGLRSIGAPADARLRMDGVMRGTNTWVYTEV